VDTVAGGIVVDVRPPRSREATDACFDMETLEPAVAARLRLERAGAAGRGAAGLAAELGCTRARLEHTLEQLTEDGTAARGGGRWFDGIAWRRAAARARERVAVHHREQPLHPGISREALRAHSCPEMPQESWRELLEELERRGDLRLDGEAVARVDHRVVLEGQDRVLADRISERFRQAGLEPPELDEVVPDAERARAAPIVDWLVTQGELVRVHNRGLFHGEALQDLRAKLREFAAKSRRIDVAAFKKLTGVTRKNAIPLLEYLDGERATRRVGDAREILL
jgi:selenocysteine-specific elongation factor